MARTKRAWQRMLSGRRLDLLDPSPLDIEISDIAHGLAFVARWNGQTSGEWAYSVAEHSILVEDIFHKRNPQAEPVWRMAALLHDAPEYVIGDMISPVKSALGQEYAKMDQRIAAAIHTRFGVPVHLPVPVKRLIKQADRISARIEALNIAGFNQSEVDRLFPSPKGLQPGSHTITLRPPSETRAAFLHRFEAIIALMNQPSRDYKSYKTISPV